MNLCVSCSGRLMQKREVRSVDKKVWVLETPEPSTGGWKAQLRQVQLNVGLYTEQGTS